MINGRGSTTTTAITIIIAELSSIRSSIIMMIIITRKSMLSRVIKGINDRLVLIQKLIDRHITTIAISPKTDHRGTTIMMEIKVTSKMIDNKSSIITTLSKATIVAAINLRTTILILPTPRSEETRSPRRWTKVSKLRCALLARQSSRESMTIALDSCMGMWIIRSAWSQLG